MSLSCMIWVLSSFTTEWIFFHMQTHVCYCLQAWNAEAVAPPSLTRLLCLCHAVPCRAVRMLTEMWIVWPHFTCLLPPSCCFLWISSQCWCVGLLWGSVMQTQPALAYRYSHNLDTLQGLMSILTQLLLWPHFLLLRDGSRAVSMLMCLLMCVCACVCGCLHVRED